MSSKKILYLCDFPIDSIGGAQKSLLSMAYAMDEMGYNIIITSDIMEDKDYVKSKNIIVEEWKKPKNKYAAVISKIRFLRKCIKKHKPDIVHAQFSQYAYAMILARKWGLISDKIPLVFTDRHHFLGYNNRYKEMFTKNIGYLKKVIFTTENNLREWEKALGHKLEQSEVVPNILDDKWFELCPSNRMDTEKVYVGFAGRYIDWKRWDTVIEIAERLCIDEKYVISIAISALEGEDELVDKYIEALREKSNGQLLVRKSANESEMMKFYSELDFFVLTSENESFGRTLVEAMTQENVVMCTKSGGAPEVVGRDDMMFELLDSEKACEIIREISSDESKMKLCKEWFLERSKLFNRETMKQKMNKIYVELLATNKEEE